MRVAYILATNMASTFKLATMILPQLERSIHGATVVGMMFLDDNVYYLRLGDEIGERLARIAKRDGIVLMACDQYLVRRGYAEGTLDMCGTGSVRAKGLVEGVQAGCLPQFDAALAGNPPDQVITL
ncbi:MAG: SaoD/DsrE family protein [bacterium]